MLFKRLLFITAILGVHVGGLFCEETPTVINVPVPEGVNTNLSPQTLPINMAQDASNVLFDNGRAEKIQGYATYVNFYTSASVRNSWEYIQADGTRWLIVASSGYISGYDGSSTSTIISGLDVDNNVDCVQFAGELWCTNRSTDVFHLNGTSVTYVSAAPKASHIDAFRNRIVLADVSGSQSTLYLSGELNGEDWTVGTMSTSPVTWRVGGVDDAGHRIRGLSCGYGDFCQVFTEDEMWGFFGIDQRNFKLSRIYEDAGCVSDSTIRQHHGILRWLSGNGVESFDQNVLSYPLVSDDIKPDLDAFLALSASELNWIQTTQADWEAGTLTGLSASYAVGSVMLSTWAATDTASSDFGAGTSTNVSSTVVAGTLSLSTGAYDLSFEDFAYNPWTETDTSGSYDTDQAFCVGGDYDGTGSAGCGAVSQTSGSPINNNLYVEVVNNADGTSLANQTISNTGSWTQQTISMSSHVGRVVKLRFSISGVSTATVSVESPPFTVFGGSDVTFYFRAHDVGTYNEYLNFDLFTGMISSMTAGNLVSQTFNTALSSPSWRPSDASFKSYGHTISFETQSSTDSSTWSSLVAWTTGSAPTSPWQTYIRYKVSIATTSSGTGFPYIDDVSLVARQATGTFTSQSHNAGAMTSFGNYEATYDLDNGSMTFYVRTATSAAMLTSAAWVQQTPFTTITAGTNPFVQEEIRFQISVATYNPTLFDTTMFWNTGEAIPTPVALVHDGRYHLFYSTSSGTDVANSAGAVLQRNNRWTFFDGLSPASVVIYNNRMLFGDSADTGLVYQAYSGDSFNNSDITASITFRDFDDGNPDAYKYFDVAYWTLDHEADPAYDVDVNVSYSIDGSTETYSLGTINLAENVGRINAKTYFPRDGTNLQFGRWITPRLTSTGTNAPFSFHGMRIYGVREDVER